MANQVDLFLGVVPASPSPQLLYAEPTQYKYCSLSSGRVIVCHSIPIQHHQINSTVISHNYYHGVIVSSLIILKDQPKTESRNQQ